MQGKQNAGMVVVMEESMNEERSVMVRGQIEARGIRDPRVLAAMREVPREEFVPATERAWACSDHPLPLGHGQTISQPYIVALMTEALALRPTDRVLEVGAGSGYQSAVLARMVERVCALEYDSELAAGATRALARLGVANVDLRCGDGREGWPEPGSEFDAILVACAATEVPPRLLAQLAPGGRMVLPLGEPDAIQRLVLIERPATGPPVRRDLGSVRFVPML